ncbi:MAG: starch synthase, partial [Hydrogenovibrio crunogenus]|nr:starch synthase [Hydrogenovibrio crunogenus]
HSTGGLSDTVVKATKENRATGQATGFVVYDPSRHALKSTILHALHLFSKKGTWQKLQKNGMRQDFSWTRSAKQYLALFKAMV